MVLIGFLWSCFIGFLAAAGAPDASLEFRLGVSRTHHAVPDTILVVATATNTSPKAFRTWGLFDFSGGYKASEETHDRWRTLRDALNAAAIGPHFRCHSPRLPTVFVVPRIMGERLRRIALAPGESYSDTLRFQHWDSEFEPRPGYIEISGEFIMGTGPDTAGAVRLGKRDLRIAIPVP
jgi:hypothetical protein